MSATAQRRGGRGARERIVAAATALFAGEGIHSTGVARLVETAEVSTRTFYQHFPSKDALVTEYLRQLRAEPEAALDRTDRTPRERLLDVFAVPTGRKGVFRGCPFHNAAVEAAGAMPPVRELVRAHKETFTARLTDTAREAGAADPESLGRALAVVFEGGRALATSMDDVEPLRDARATAELLIDRALAHVTTSV